MKRLFDLLLVVVTLPLWLPLLALLALLVWGVEGRPVLFRQERIGWRDATFMLLKFRTMRLGEGSDSERLTRFGGWLRSSSLDELPQLLNVLRGEMSLVGPRPLPVRYLPRYSSEQRRRHEVRPGITGWAQVKGRNLLTWPERLALDVWYVTHRSFRLDLKILWLTVIKVVRREGIAAATAATMEEFTG